MNPRLKRRLLLAGLPLAVCAAAAVAVMATAVSAAPGKPPPPAPKPVAGQVTVYSQTFFPYKRFSDDESLQQYRYESGPGNAPNTFRWHPPDGYYAPDYDGPSMGVDAFFNMPDLTIGATPMSVVSAQVCLSLVNTPDDGSAVTIDFGVQDQDQNVTYTTLMLTTTDQTQACPTLTLPHPIELVNRPHLVTTAEIQLPLNDKVLLDGVTYILQPTQKGDVPPGPGNVNVTPGS